ncbi:MAG: hypothetical protein IKV77_05200 [Alistipes sp.]|nr:hypothetical protein [Bacteroidales bacterium]MBR5492508.1 hypothetical protein [Alistipes sp.]MBR5920040.1 hypothetical protein [Bacteroidales bacterium]
MEYRFILNYKPTDPEEQESSFECHPLYGDDLSATLTRENGEWYRKRAMEGRLTFERGDYDYIMRCAFDGTFTLTILCCTRVGGTWLTYFEGTFSRANMEIDEDNRRAYLNGLSESGEYNVLENSRNEEYDLVKLIPESEKREVRGNVPPALAMIDYRYLTIESSDMFCGAPFVGNGFVDQKFNDWNLYQIVSQNVSWNLVGMFGEAVVKMEEGQETPASGRYCGNAHYHAGISLAATEVDMYNENGYRIHYECSLSSANNIVELAELYDADNNHIITVAGEPFANINKMYSPNYFVVTEFGDTEFLKLEIIFHYIRASLLTANYDAPTMGTNVLDTGKYYKGMQAFAYSGIRTVITTNTTETPNGHALLPGTGVQGTVPQYFAPPDESEDWIPLAEQNWTHASMWYTIVPNVENGLLDPAKVGAYSWRGCWTLGTCLNYLLRKITTDKVFFEENTSCSEFLYENVNPVTYGEPFAYLFTQKSNVMTASSGQSAARCIVTLGWFLDFMRNALNCYWWLEPRNGGTYAFRVEHVEWFRRGGSYTRQMDAQFNLTEIKPLRNFMRDGEAAKRLDDKLHKYTYDMIDVTEKYTFGWQGDGGSDDFKGNPMFFRSGWIEKGTSESHEVDNIFADLSWLMLNAGTDTASSKNYDGLFVFSGYRPIAATAIENEVPSQILLLATSSQRVSVSLDVWLTAPEGMQFTLQRHWTVPQQGSQTIATYTGTGQPQAVSVELDVTYPVPNSLGLNFGANYAQVTIHRIHAHTGDLYNVPNVANLLSDDPLIPTMLLNGPLAWPWLQNEYLHYDIPAQRWSYDSDDIDTATFEATGTVKMAKRQEVPLLPLPTKNDEVKLEKGVIGGLRDSQNQLQTGLVETATVNLTSRNCKLTLAYDMVN